MGGDFLNKKGTYKTEIANFYYAIILLLIGLIMLSAVYSVSIGQVHIPFKQSMEILIHALTNGRVGSLNNIESESYLNIILQIRMPRVIFALLIGMGLSLCGTIMQAVVQNPLADPYILGISSGASLGATFAIMIGFGSGAFLSQFGVAFGAFVGAMITSIAVLVLSSIGGKATSVKLVLSGVVIGALCGSFSSLIIYFANDTEGIKTVTFWSMGSLASSSWEKVPIMAIIILLGCGMFLFQHRVLNTMLLGDESAITLGINIETDMRKKLFDHIQKLSFRFFDNNKTGHLVSRMTNDLMDIGEIAHHGPEDLFIAVMTLFGAFGLMLSINWKLAVLTFIIIPFLICLSIYFSRKMSHSFSQMFADIADFNARVENNVGGILVVKAFANEEHEMEQFAINNGRFRKTKLVAYKVMAWNSSISHLLMKVVSLFVLGCGTWFVIDEQMTFGEFMAFVLLSNVFLTPIQQINSVIETYPKGVAGFRRYLDLLKTAPDEKDKLDAIEVQHVNGDIEYKNVPSIITSAYWNCPTGCVSL
jgi:ABC-type Fe3+-siderophore transport system permease subunit